MAAYRRVCDSRHLSRTGISSGTLRSEIEYGLPLPLLTKFEGGLNLLHEADDDSADMLESTATAALAISVINN